MRPGTISLPTAASDLATSGSGSILMTTARNIVFASGSSLTTVDGPITLNANQQASPTTGNVRRHGCQRRPRSKRPARHGVVTVNGKGGTAGAGQLGVYRAQRRPDQGRQRRRRDDHRCLRHWRRRAAPTRTAWTSRLVTAGCRRCITSLGGNVRVTRLCRRQHELRTTTA